MTSLALFSAGSCFAQIPYVDSKDLLQKGVELHDKGEYKKAVELYRQVHECDTNYARAVYEQVLSLQADSAFEASKKLALEALRLRGSNKRELLLTVAANYDYLNKQDSALVIYDQIRQLYPHDNQPLYETGIIHFKKKDYDKALQYFCRSLVLNPNHYRSHYMTGLTYVMQGRLSEAFIALEASLLVTQKVELAKQSISLISSITEGTDEVVKLAKEKDEKYSHPLFDELDQLLLSKLALNRKYQLKISLNDNIFRQTQAVMEKLKYVQADSNFVMQYYAPLLTDIFSNDMFESYVLLLFSDFGYENVDNLAKRKSKEVADVKKVVFPYFSKIQGTRELVYSKRKNTAERYNYYPSDNLIIIGETKQGKDGNIVVGDADIYASNHTLQAKGRYNKAGAKDGWWDYYYASGKLKSREFFVNGEMRDSSYSYYSNGNLSRVTTRDKKGDPEVEYDYHYNGWLSEVRKKLPGKAVEEQSYYSNGQKEVVTIYEDGKVKDGASISYHRNGKMKMQANYLNGKYSGGYKTYFDNGKLSQDANYVNGNLEGQFTSYYQSGGVKEKYGCDNGKANGPYEEYFLDGKLCEKGIYKKGTKTEVVKYSSTGREYANMRLNKGAVVLVKFTDENNNPIFEAEDKKGMTEYPLYNAWGAKMVDMKIGDEGDRDGMLNFYYATGAKSDEINYKNGNLSGVTKAFYVDGKIKDEESYIDDKKDGYFKSYHANGVIKDEGWYKEGKKQGLWRQYHINGKVRTEQYYLNDEFDGYYKEYNVNGEITDKYLFDIGLAYAHICYDTEGVRADSVTYGPGITTCQMTHSRMIPRVVDQEYGIRYGANYGDATYRYIHGKLKQQIIYKDGDKDSLGITYFPDGSIESRGNYAGGSRVGHWILYNEAGELIREDNYDSYGAAEGKRKIYSCGIVRVETNFVDGNRDGGQVYYGDNGRKALVLIYEKGLLRGYTHEGKDGQMLPVIRIKNGTANIVAYYNNGQKSAEVQMNQEMINGPLKIYYSNGQLAEERNLKGFDLDGAFRRYNPDGKLVYEAEYKDDEEHGIERTFDKNGNLIISATYYYGSLQGPASVTAGGKTTTYNYHYGVLTGIQ
jgi:antitoxin component YwqK of YwqJK toxin-antitoxin module